MRPAGAASGRGLCGIGDPQRAWWPVFDRILGDQPEGRFELEEVPRALVREHGDDGRAAVVE